jgi:putative endonuclease
MASHNTLGKQGEQLAVGYLTQLGYKILHHNWRYSHYEIDLIAVKKDMLKIVEVKSLRSSVIRFPEVSVTREKFRRIRKAADQFLFMHRKYRHVQFDVLSIVVPPNGEPQFFLIEDVFL